MAKVHQTPSLADALTVVRTKAGRALRTDIVLDGLTPADRDILEDWLRDASMPACQIEAALATHATTTGGDHTVSANAISKWREHNGVG